MSKWSNLTEFLVKSGMSQCRISLTLSKFKVYKEMLADWNTRINLTAITDEQEIITKHFLDSCSPIKIIGSLYQLDLNSISQTTRKDSIMTDRIRLADLGSGAGFPGIPLAILYPQLNVTLVDSIGKKIKFLDSVIQELQLDNTTAIHTRIENLAHSPTFRGSFDMTTCRAFSEIRTNIEVMSPLLKVNGWMLMYKRGSIQDELKHALLASVKLKCDLKTNPIRITDIPELKQDDRCIVLAQQKEIPPKKYPRKQNQPWKNPL